MFRLGIRFTVGSRHMARQPTVSQAAAARAAAMAGVGLDEQWTIDFTAGRMGLDCGFRRSDDVGAGGRNDERLTVPGDDLLGTFDEADQEYTKRNDIVGRPGQTHAIRTVMATPEPTQDQESPPGRQETVPHHEA